MQMKAFRQGKIRRYRRRLFQAFSETGGHTGEREKREACRRPWMLMEKNVDTYGGKVGTAEERHSE
jgi:hypothetical protein